jgi:hypothetical protein
MGRRGGGRVMRGGGIGREGSIGEGDNNGM